MHHPQRAKLAANDPPRWHTREASLGGEAWIGTLDHLLEGHAVVPPERGIFLSKTWRMHPDLCSFVSAAVYEGKLLSEAGCATQRLVLTKDAHPRLKGAGLAFFPVDHFGCRQKSNEEAREVRDLLMNLLGQHVIGRDGLERSMTLDDVLLVAPYNMQVNLLRSILPDGARMKLSRTLKSSCQSTHRSR